MFNFSKTKLIVVFCSLFCMLLLAPALEARCRFELNIGSSLFFRPRPVPVYQPVLVPVPAYYAPVYAPYPYVRGPRIIAGRGYLTPAPCYPGYGYYNDF